MRILTLTKPKSGVDYHRIMLPMRWMDFQKGDSLLTVFSGAYLYEDAFAHIDIVMFSRECPFELNQILNFQKKYKFKIVVDVDDYWKLYPTHYLSPMWEHNKTEYEICKSMQIADLVTTTHEKLADKIRKYNSNVVVVPNALPFGEGQFKFEAFETHLRHGTILYVGGASHLDDLRSISNALGMCRNNFIIQQEFELVIAGYNASNADSKYQWDRILKAGSVFGNNSHLEGKSPGSYMELYKEGDLCIAPLVKNEFNTYKSNLKILEAGAAALPIIVTNIHPYDEDKCQGLIQCSSQRDWYEAILNYAKNPSQLEADGLALYKYVKEKYDLKEVNKARYTYLKSIL